MTNDKFKIINSNVNDFVNDKIKNYFTIHEMLVKIFLTRMFVKEFLTIDEIVIIDKNILNLINFNILTQRLLIR